MKIYFVRYNLIKDNIPKERNLIYHLLVEYCCTSLCFQENHARHAHVSLNFN